jgi:hypothetical protein
MNLNRGYVEENVLVLCENIYIYFTYTSSSFNITVSILFFHGKTLSFPLFLIELDLASLIILDIILYICNLGVQSYHFVLYGISNFVLELGG